MSGSICLSGCLVALALASASVHALTARVENTPGGPQIMVDGQPVPPRMFWGNPGAGGAVAAGREWAEKAFEFSLAFDVEGKGTLHFRFGQNPGEVWIADVRVVEAASGRDVLKPGSFATAEAFADVWNLWPPGEQNTVGKVNVADGTVHVVLTNPPQGKWPDFHFHSDQNLSFRAHTRYRCSFRVRAVPERSVTTALYSVDKGTWTRIGSPPGPFLQQVAIARDAAVNIVSFAAPNCWQSPDKETDWVALDGLCREIIAVNPKVLLLPRVGADAPRWWLDQHPEALMVYEDGRKGPKASVSHRQYRADAAAHLERLCRHLAETFPQHFAGIHPCGQNTGEWFYEDTWKRELSGYDPATLQAWREWLRKRGDGNADRAEAPDAKSRHAAPHGLLRNPALERRLIDFNRFQQDEMSDMVVALAAAARRGTAGKGLVVFFYGYHYEFGAIGNGAPICGHYGLRRVLQSPDIDILCSPVSYFDRQLYGTGPCMSPAESIMAAGKLWLNEDDTRTYLDPRKAEKTQEGGLVNLEQTKAIMLRNTAQAALRGFGTWWMDLPGQGWFADPAIWQEIVRLRPVDEAMARRPKPFTPDIAAIIGEDSVCHLAGGAHRASRPLIYESRAALGRCGAPYGQLMLDDAIAGKVTAKLQVFLAAWSLTPEQRQQLAARRPSGVTRVWCYAPGYLLPDRADVAAMREVTGFTHREVSPPSSTATPTPEGSKLGLKDSWGPKDALKPLFAVDATPAETLATYADGSPAVAMRRSQRGLDVFIGVPQLTSDLVRALARLAGVHLFTTEDAALWATDAYLSIHAVKDGPLTIHTGRGNAITDALDGAPLGRGPELKLDIRAGETRVLRY